MEFTMTNLATNRLDNIALNGISETIRLCPKFDYNLWFDTWKENRINLEEKAYIYKSYKDMLTLPITKVLELLECQRKGLDIPNYTI